MTTVATSTGHLSHISEHLPRVDRRRRRRSDGPPEVCADAKLADHQRRKPLMHAGPASKQPPLSPNNHQLVRSSGDADDSAAVLLARVRRSQMTAA